MVETPMISLDNKVILIVILGSRFRLGHQCYENFVRKGKSGKKERKEK